MRRPAPPFLRKGRSSQADLTWPDGLSWWDGRVSPASPIARSFGADLTEWSDARIAEHYAWLAPRHDRLYSVRATMVGSLDGRASLGGRSGSLGNPADQRLMELLRDLADVVLVGAGTIRAEGYGTLPVTDRRRKWGSVAAPRLVVVTSGRPQSLSPDMSIFDGSGPPPMILTSESGAHELAGLPAEIVPAGDETVDLAAGLDALARRGLRRIQTEGGPSLLGRLLEADLLDELCLTIAPFVVGPSEPGLTGSLPSSAAKWSLIGLLRSEQHLFGRYRRPE